MKKTSIPKVINIILKNILKAIIFPFKTIFNFFVLILKRFKFSIAFKISSSYMLLYLFVITIAAFLSTLGLFAFEVTRFEKEEIEMDLINIVENFPDYEEISRMIDGNNIKRIYIYDENLNSIYSSARNDRYSNNIIVMLENIIFNKQYLHSSCFDYDNHTYYTNIYYSFERNLEHSRNVFLLFFISGAFGLLIFVPVVSGISYKLVGPIKKMTEITKTITVNNINTRIDTKGIQDELKELSQTFNEMMDRIENGYKSQQQFVSDASHELRTPIAVIKGYVNMLDRWGKNDKDILDESIGAIKNEADNMQDLIEKLLFIARSDKQTLLFSKEDMRICDILFEIEKETGIIDTKHNFKYNFYDDALIYGDKNRIKQAVRIFIENAIKFTPVGEEIELTGYIEGEYYIISVKDKGIGIDKEDLNKIFNRLYRAEQSRSKGIGGHGLGLSIAKIIVLGHKGKIKVKSVINKGSEFMIMLPYLQRIE